MGSEKLLFRLEQPHGSGDVYIMWQKGSGNYFATTGIDCMVNIFDRYGQIVDRIRLPGVCAGFGWDSDGDLLGIISQSSQLILWDASTNKKTTFDVGLKDNFSCLIWAKTSPLLAIGTVKGNVCIYNHNTSKRTPVIGKHTKRIICGAWNSDNLLALGSEDKTVSVSNLEGDTLRAITLRADPAEIQFSEMKLDERIGGDNTISMIIGKKTLYLYNLLDPENPVELAFQQHYGAIIAYRWFGDGYILIGFSAGYFIAISTHIKEVGQELFQIRNHKNMLTDIAICETIGKAASCGDNNIKIHNLSDLQETSGVLTLDQESALERISWSSDGQLLAVTTRGGSINVYISQMPILTAVCAPRIAILSSLTEISLYNYVSDKSKLKPVTVSLELEPSFIAVGQYHLAVGMNNRTWFYDLTQPEPGVEDSPLKLKDRQYLGNVDSVCLNPEYASVLFEGKLLLHMIEQPEVCHEDRESMLFPDDSSSNIFITCHALTIDFLIYATDMGHIVYFNVEEWAKCGEYKHYVGISNIYVDSPGSRLVFIDIKSQGYVLNSVTYEVVPIQDLPDKILGVTWDSNITDRNIFIVYNEHEIYTYIYVKFSILGSFVKRIGQTSLVSKQFPLLMHKGEVLSATSSGQLTELILTSHVYSHSGLNERDPNILESNLNKQLALHRFGDAWHICEILKSKSLWKKLATETLKYLEIDFAMRIYRELEDASMVMSLKELHEIEEHKLLCGYINMYLNDYDKAQEWFLKADTVGAKAALDMRRDLLQWDQALQLTNNAAPDQVAVISREYAQQLEFVSNYSEACKHYEIALQQNLSEDHTFICRAGIARTSLHCGKYRQGISIALELDNRSLMKECAEILEKKKQMGDSALLFEKCQNYDRAALSYIKLKNWNKVRELLPNINSSKVYLQYAKAQEGERNYDEAVKAYSLAKDFDSVVRLQLDHLNNPEVAVEIVQETKSVQGSKLIAKFFQQLNDYTSAIRFLVLSKCIDEAHELAKQHGKMELYGEILVNSLSPDEMKPQYFSSVATHFENEKNHLLAGKHWYYAKEYNKAMKHLLRAAKSNSRENEALTAAIDVVASSKDENLSTQLIEFLLGESNGMPKDPKYLFRLYMAKKQFKEASKSALIIANEEQINGNYRNAHDVLFAMYQELKQNGIKIPNDMQANLLLLHSYILVKLHVRRGDHLRGARMLIRVANNISKFPSHIVPILTSTVIECHRAGLKYASHKFATMLMNPEYRKKIDDKYAKKIEAIVRRPPKSAGGDAEGIHGDPLEPFTPCPYCESLVPETEVTCNSCKNNIPFCIVTGNHIVKDDLTACPECDFPAIRKEFVSILSSEDSCPMCSEKVDQRRLVRITDPRRYLNLE